MNSLNTEQQSALIFLSHNPMAYQKEKNLFFIRKFVVHFCIKAQIFLNLCCLPRFMFSFLWLLTSHEVESFRFCDSTMAESLVKYQTEEECRKAIRDVKNDKSNTDWYKNTHFESGFIGSIKNLFVCTVVHTGSFNPFYVWLFLFSCVFLPSNEKLLKIKIKLSFLKA
jgi:hypothetical protein